MAKHPFFPDDTEYSDRRFFPRWHVQNRLLFKTNNSQQECQGWTRDISCSGACIRLPENLSKNQKLKITICLSESKSVLLDAVVLWAKSCGQENRTGIQFLEVSEDDQKALLDHAFELRPDQVVNSWFQGWSEDKSDD